MHISLCNLYKKNAKYFKKHYQTVKQIIGVFSVLSVESGRRKYQNPVQGGSPVFFTGCQKRCYKETASGVLDRCFQGKVVLFNPGLQGGAGHAQQPCSPPA